MEAAPPLGGVDEAKSFCCEGGVKRRGLPLPLLVAAEGALRRGGGGGGVPGALLGPASLSSVLLLYAWTELRRKLSKFFNCLTSSEPEPCLSAVVNALAICRSSKPDAASRP